MIFEAHDCVILESNNKVIMEEEVQIGHTFPQ